MSPCGNPRTPREHQEQAAGVSAGLPPQKRPGKERASMSDLDSALTALAVLASLVVGGVGIYFGCVLGLGLWRRLGWRKRCRRVVLYVDRLDHDAITRTVAFVERRLGGLPDGEGNLDGRAIGEICRGYEEMVQMGPKEKRLGGDEPACR